MAKKRASQPGPDPKSLDLELHVTKSTNGLAEWRACLKGEEAHLNEVERVIYVLPSTYANPVRTKSDRTSRFLLEEECSGDFTLHARVIRSNRYVSPSHLIRRQAATSAPRRRSDHRYSSTATRLCSFLALQPLLSAVTAPAPQRHFPLPQLFLPLGTHPERRRSHQPSAKLSRHNAF